MVPIILLYNAYKSRCVQVRRECRWREDQVYNGIFATWGYREFSISYHTRTQVHAMHNNSFYVLLLLSSSLLRICFIVQHYGPSRSFRVMYRRYSVMAGWALFCAHAHTTISAGASLCVCAAAVAKWKMHTDRPAVSSPYPPSWLTDCIHTCKIQPILLPRRPPLIRAKLHFLFSLAAPLPQFIEWLSNIFFL
jgi:hypothetical protein